MADPRFFTNAGSLTLAQISGCSGAELQNSEEAGYIVEGVAGLDQAGPNQLSFLDNPKFRGQFQNTKAGACIIHPDMVALAPKGVRLLLSRSPYKSYALAAQALYPEPMPEPTIAATAFIHPTAKIGKGCVIENFVVIGAEATIGEGTWVQSHAAIGFGVTIGANSRIGNHVSVSHALIGKHVRLYPGVRVGQDGFGFAIDPAGFVKVPQLGRVIIGDHVEVGANTTIDRGAMGDTEIGAGTWIDNLVQIAHNVKIGRCCILVAQVGIAGSTELEDFVVLGGQAGVAGHLKIGTQARIAAHSGVTRDVPAKSEWMGYPAMPMKRYLRQVAVLNRQVDQKSHIPKNKIDEED